MSKDSATVIKDGQLAVATVPQTGTLVGAASEIDATALVETADGLQLCVKTCEVGGGGGGGTVDQTYDPTSTNAQSGTAVAEAVAPALKNTATDTNALTILGTATDRAYSVNIGHSSSAYGVQSTAVGYGAQISGEGSVAVGMASYATGRYSVAIGRVCRATANNAIQLGSNGSLQTENSTANSFQVYSYTMLDGTTGKIPMARLPIVQCTQAEYDALVLGGTVDANTIYCIIPA